MIKKVLIANRGEIALRILRACRELDIQTVAVYAKGDAHQMHVYLADEAICIGDRSLLSSYLNMPNVIAAAQVTGACAIHPGYGFLAENPRFAQLVVSSGFIYIGPKAKHIALMGNKISAINMMRKIGLPTIPGSNGPLTADLVPAVRIADEIGYPVILKAASGGGGRSMQVVHRPAELKAAIAQTQSQAKSLFDDPTIYIEKYLSCPRHIEVQVLGDQYGQVLTCGERDCSIQRRHQKVIEEAPAAILTATQRQSIQQLCRRACEEIGYVSAGTFEFLYQDGQFYFIEMNTRIQVEHPVTEQVYGIDLIKAQLVIAARQSIPCQQSDIQAAGYALECRINAEHPYTFLPSPGKVTFYHPPSGPGIRVDSGLFQNYEISHYYDSLVAKVISFAPTRQLAIKKMSIALDEMIVEGVQTNIPLHQCILKDPGFVNNDYNINFVAKLLSERSDETVRDEVLV